MSDLSRLVSFGLLVSSEDQITDEISKSVADSSIEEDRRFQAIMLAAMGVAGFEKQPADCVIGAVNYLVNHGKRYASTGEKREFLREWVAAWQLADEWEDTNTGAEEMAQEFIEQLAESEETAEQPFFEPGRYEDITNTDYHASNGISSSQVKDARISLMYFHGKHIAKTIKRETSEALTFGSLFHTTTLEPEKVGEEFNVYPEIPAGALTNADSMKSFIEAYNSTLPEPLATDDIKAMLQAHNETLPQPYPLGGNAEEIGNIYTSLPAEFQTIPGESKHTASAMKACIKEYNATLPEPLPTTGSRDALLSQLELIKPQLVEEERAKPQKLNFSGKKDDLAAAIKSVAPDAVFADDLISAWQKDTVRTPVTTDQNALAVAMANAVLNHPDAGPIVNHPTRAVEVSYYGYDDETGLEIRVRPDLEIELNGLRIGFDLKSTSMGRIKQNALRTKIHREIIDRDYHVSAAMYCDLAELDQFFWIFVNKDEGYHWVAIVEASPDELELGRLEYKQTLRDIKNAMDADTWPAPVTTALMDELNDFDLRRLEALRAA